MSDARAARIMKQLCIRLNVAQAIDPKSARHANNSSVKPAQTFPALQHHCELPFDCVSKTQYFSRRNAIYDSSKHDSEIFFDTIALQISEDRSHVIQTLHRDVLRAWTVIKDLH